jgi:hypothetical protein
MAWQPASFVKACANRPAKEAGMFKRILIGLVLIVGGLLIYASTKPNTYHVERSTRIDAPATVVFSQMEDFKAWGAWSPWDKLDPNMKKSYDGPPKGVGASYAWEGNNKVGQGKMTIKDAKPPTSITYELQFIKPFAAVATTSFNLAPEGDKASKVTWAMDGNNNLIGKVFSIFMNMDKTIGADFERGLAGLKTVSEAEAKKQSEAAAQAAKVEAEAAAVAAAKAQATEASAAADTKKKRPARR